MHPVLMTPSGIPRSGLVCWHDLYDPTESLASVPDLSGNGYDLQLGSTAGADTNDPAWGADGKGLVFVTDDYCTFTPAYTWGDPLSIVMVVKGAAQTDHRLFSLGLSTSDTPIMSLSTSAAAPTNKLRVYARSQQSNALYQDSAAVAFDDVWRVVGCVVAASAFSFFVSGAIESYAHGGFSGTATFDRGGIGALLRTGAGSYFNGSMGNVVQYNRALSDAEIQRIYRSLKATWAARGVTIL